jgi:hypothetical protein
LEKLHSNINPRSQWRWSWLEDWILSMVPGKCAENAAFPNRIIWSD